MDKTLFGLELKIENPDQILNMGGPWVGTVYLGDSIISDHCIFDNLLADGVLKQIYYVKYHRISEWRADNYFTINYCCFITFESYQFERKFGMVYLEKMLSKNELEIFHAFHNKNIEKRDVFNIHLENKIKVN